MSDSYAVEDLAAFVVAAQNTDLGSARQCCCGATIVTASAAPSWRWTERPPRWCATSSSPPGQHRASMIGGGQTSVDQAALFNSVAVRYVDSDGRDFG
jgi:2-methylcitrate dehydratase